MLASIALFIALLPMLATSYPAVVADFTQFHKEVQLVANAPLTESQVLHENSTHMDCAFPRSSVMIAYSSHYTTPFIEAQHRAMETSGLRSCLESRFVTACLDSKCMQFCNASNIPHCVLIDFKELPPSDFNKGEYRFFTFFKHELLYEALKFAEHVFFFDADVAIFKNPFVETQFGRDEDGNRILAPYDLMFQRDRGRGPSCAGSVNSGQIYLRNSSAVRLYLHYMHEMKPVIIEGKHGLDQDFVQNASQTAGLRSCSLHPTLYTAHCYQIFGNIRYMDHGQPVKKLVTYHTSCKDGLNSKLALLSRVTHAVKEKSSQPIIHVLRV